MTSSAFDPRFHSHDSSRIPRRGARRASVVATLALAATVFAVSTIAPDKAAACRDAGTVSIGADGTTYTSWSDGAWLRQYTNGIFEWFRPAGTEPIPGISPGHNPYAEVAPTP